jgi:hypothetical protein
VGSETGRVIDLLDGETGLATRTDQRRRSKTEPAAVQDDAGGAVRRRKQVNVGHASYSNRSITSYSTGCATSGVAGSVDRPASIGDSVGGRGLAMHDYPHPT